MNSEVTKIQDHGPDMAHLISVVSTLERKQNNYFSGKADPLLWGNYLWCTSFPELLDNIGLSIPILRIDPSRHWPVSEVLPTDVERG